MPAAELRKAVLLGWHQSGSLEPYLIVKGTTFFGKFVLALINLMDSSKLGLCFGLVLFRESSRPADISTIVISQF